MIAPAISSNLRKPVSFLGFFHVSIVPITTIFDRPPSLSFREKMLGENHSSISFKNVKGFSHHMMIGHARPIVFLATFTGLRKSNALGIQIENIDLGRRTITVIQKGGKHHVVKIHAALVPMLEQVIDGRTGGPLWVYGQSHCDCALCSEFRKPATSGKSHYVTGLDRPGTTKRVRCIETGEIFKNQTDARNTLVRRDHVNMAGADQIGQVCRGQRKSAGGYTWEFVPAPTPLPVRNSRYRGGEPILTIDSAFDTARKRIGRKDLRIHDLRHTIATWLTRDGTPLPIVQTHLGHRRIETTLRYAHTDVSAVTPFLDEILDGGALPWHGEGAGISGSNGTDPEQNPNNKAPQKRPNGSVPVMFEGSDRLRD